MALPPRESGKYIAERAKHISIVEEGVDALADLLVEEYKAGRLGSENFYECSLHPHPNDPQALNWLIVVDTLNFCFWHDESEEGWKVEGHTGYFALCAAITRARKEEPEFLNPAYYAAISELQLKKILRSDTKSQCPLITERVKCLQEVGNVLNEKFQGSFENVVKESNRSAVKLMNLVVDNFPCFRDEATFQGQKVSFYKRAQILVGDIWACFRSKGIGYFEDIYEITAFADYRVPQSLMWHGILKYSAQLNEVLNSNVVLENGDEREVEIRGCCIHAVELLKERVNKNLGKLRVTSIVIDHWLWKFRRDHSKQVLKRKIPFHKTFSIYY
ncbi:queuosine 5'-phosphate N-glycosylase/hydrolase [Leptinotarsa decemlineata]|uniref:queuosine 5'-phosphate N-glycosylase/hydrolase n=1 Tax=Leptinotarsa decemlineata TaxID=7539 RepID=UPI000C252131|nr:queuosine salvage protein [Leptinotarsa decemlineata]